MAATATATARARARAAARCTLFVLYCPCLFFSCHYHTLSSLSTYLALRRCTLFYSSLVLCLCSNCLPTTGRCVDPRLLALVHLAPHFQDPALLQRSGRAPYQSPARTDAPIPTHPTTPAGTELRYTPAIASAIPPRLPPGLRPTSGRLFKRGKRGLSLRFHPRPSLPEPRFRLTAQPLRDV